MSWETYRFGNRVKIRRVGAVTPPDPDPIQAVAYPAVILGPDATKAEIVAEAEARGIDSSGTKAEILERLNG